MGVGEHGEGQPHGQIANSRKGNASYIKPRHEWGESVTRLHTPQVKTGKPIVRPWTTRRSPRTHEWHKDKEKG
ncbi:hypothetical protein TNCV_2157331 [Trichonephila clavipes]|nr:hypothetical protein TNCV_2157331 [Trichonephila clavipes]